MYGIFAGLGTYPVWVCFVVPLPSQSFLMRAEEQQKQMELPVGLWEHSGRARTTVVGGN